MTFNTSPLPFISNIDDKIYEYDNVFLDKELCPPKRAKSVSSKKSMLFEIDTSRVMSSETLTRTNSRSSPASLRYKRRLRIPHSRSTSNLPDFAAHFGFSSESANFFGSASDSSDLESLPDFTEDDGTPDSSPVKGTKAFDTTNILGTILDSPSIHFNIVRNIFDIPEITHRIIEFVDAQNTVILQEDTPVRRKPLSSNHALLMHGKEILSETTQTSSSEYSGALHSCLLVNKLFHTITSEILNKKLMFQSETQLTQFTRSTSNKKPELLIFHKLFTTRQAVLDTLAVSSLCLDNLRWLQFYMCPKLYPSVDFLTPSLTKLIITGSKVVDDTFLSTVLAKCPGLQVLDIRACELVTDSGVYQIGKNCTRLTTINLGRKNKGNLITDHSLSKLILNNRQLSTVGLAGCHITDKTIWDLAIHTLAHLQRLSLNNCPFITNHLIPLILSRRNNFFFNHLLVLELRFNNQLTDLIPIIQFKRRQNSKGTPLLVEVCEPLMMRLRQLELEMDKMISKRIFKDILDWVNEEDGDELYLDLLQSAASTITQVAVLTRTAQAAMT